MQAHVLHLIIHAVLHLLGFDHMKNEDARIMQKLEQRIMQHLGLHDPYPHYSTAEQS
jgi:probable rRNA maturation factor